MKTDCWRLLPPGPVERGGFDTKSGYISWMFIGLHHLVAGGLILSSFLVNPTDNGILFRHGALVALGGMDVLQTLQVLFKARPFDETPPQGAIVSDPFVIAHHLYGMMIILPANLQLSIQFVAAAGRRLAPGPGARASG